MRRKVNYTKVAREFEKGADYIYLANKYGVSQPSVLNAVENYRRKRKR